MSNRQRRFGHLATAASVAPPDRVRVEGHEDLRWSRGDARRRLRIKRRAFAPPGACRRQILLQAHGQMGVAWALTVTVVVVVVAVVAS